MKREMVEVSVETYTDFVRWSQELVRDVAQMCEPPMESFNDFSGDDIWPESVAARAKLQTAWPSIHGFPEIVDPRPKNERPTPWWRTDTEIRQDWLQKFESR